MTKQKGEHLDSWVLICRRRCSASKCNTALVNPPASLVKRFPTGLPHVSGGYEMKQYLRWDRFACLSGVLDKTDKFPRRLHVGEGSRETLNSAWFAALLPSARGGFRWRRGVDCQKSPVDLVNLLRCRTGLLASMSCPGPMARLACWLHSSWCEFLHGSQARRIEIPVHPGQHTVSA